MGKDVAVKEDGLDLLKDVDIIKNASQKLMQTPHYAKLGQEGIFAIVQKAKSLNINPLDALNGALYFTAGRVGMSAEMMNTLIRSHGHSITKDTKSNDTICILHGKRADNGDTWTESFSIEDAKRAGIYKDATPWGKYPRNMCFNRALSNLARQLFPDVIKGCYEIDELKSFAEAPVQNFSKMATADVEMVVESELTKEQIDEFYKNFNGDEEMTRAYVTYYMAKRKYSEAKVIAGLSEDPAASHKAYASWKAKQKPIENVQVFSSAGSEFKAIEPTSMEPASLFDGEGK